MNAPVRRAIIEVAPETLRPLAELAAMAAGIDGLRGLRRRPGARSHGSWQRQFVIWALIRYGGFRYFQVADLLGLTPPYISDTCEMINDLLRADVDNMPPAALTAPDALARAWKIVFSRLVQYFGVSEAEKRKPEIATLLGIKTRQCLSCEKPFVSEFAGNRICGHCKSLEDWRIIGRSRLDDKAEMRQAARDAKLRAICPSPPDRGHDVPALTFSRCQFIKGEPTGDDACKCNAPTEAGGPFCAAHKSRVFVVAPFDFKKFLGLR